MPKLPRKGACVDAALVLVLPGCSPETSANVSSGLSSFVQVSGFLALCAGIVIFLDFVAYDRARAMDLPHTSDNAIDASGGLILDVVNLFIRLLEAYGKKANRD